MLPATGSHQVGIGGFVINENREVLYYRKDGPVAVMLLELKSPTCFKVFFSHCICFLLLGSCGEREEMSTKMLWCMETANRICR